MRGHSQVCGGVHGYALLRLSALTCASASVCSLAQAATRLLRGVQQHAQLLVAGEGRAMQQLVATAVETQMRRLELKLRHLDDLGALLRKERAHLERSRHEARALSLAEGSRACWARYGLRSTRVKTATAIV
eukprot:3501349-Pleurochrysis_carterae.AAC.2